MQDDGLPFGGDVNGDDADGCYPRPAFQPVRPPRLDGDRLSRRRDPPPAQSRHSRRDRGDPTPRGRRAGIRCRGGDRREDRPLRCAGDHRLRRRASFAGLAAARRHRSGGAPARARDRGGGRPAGRRRQPSGAREHQRRGPSQAGRPRTRRPAPPHLLRRALLLWAAGMPARRHALHADQLRRLASVGPGHGHDAPGGQQVVFARHGAPPHPLPLRRAPRRSQHALGRARPRAPRRRLPPPLRDHGIAGREGSDHDVVPRRLLRRRPPPDGALGGNLAEDRRGARAPRPRRTPAACCSGAS